MLSFCLSSPFIFFTCFVLSFFLFSFILVLCLFCCAFCFVFFLFEFFLIASFNHSLILNTAHVQLLTFFPLSFFHLLCFVFFFVFVFFFFFLAFCFTFYSGSSVCFFFRQKSLKTTTGAIKPYFLI